ncbi:hypothetical protein MCOR02_000525 [Pyricularia oryzae]|nr:hypothetical protein MCOR02_000525 [Pyricularia oryzae]
MKRLITLVVSLLIALISILIYNTPAAQNTLVNLVSLDQISFYKTTISSMLNVTRSAMSKSASSAPAAALRHAKITPHKSSSRGHADHGWLNTYHSFSFANWYDPRYTHFGSLRVLNEDRVKPNSGFPTHPHSNFEIFSYILSGELTHRDSMLRKGQEGNAGADKFYRMHRGDVQFTTGGTGISHSEFNEHNSDTVHFLQIWALPWKKGLSPRYHTRHFDDEDKRKGSSPSSARSRPARKQRLPKRRRPRRQSRGRYRFTPTLPWGRASSHPSRHSRGRLARRAHRPPSARCTSTCP